MVGRERLELPEPLRTPDLQSGALPVTLYLPIMVAFKIIYKSLKVMLPNFLSKFA